MKTNIHPNHHKSIHQHIEAVFRHKLLLTVVAVAVFLAVANTDSRFRELMRSAYNEGLGFVSHFAHHEHPQHSHTLISIARMPTVSGGQ